MSRNKEHRPNGAAAEGGASVFFVSPHLLFYSMNIYGYSLYIDCIFQTYTYICIYIYIYIYVLNIFHVLFFVWFVTYSVNGRSGHDRSQTFGPISQVSGPKLTF